jgi:hypothetical protein
MSSNPVRLSRCARLLALALLGGLSSATTQASATIAPLPLNPSGCVGYEFADTFDNAGAVADTPHHYALNSSLESRQLGGATPTTYGRRSGKNGVTTPPSDNHVQVNQPYSAPDKLSFWLDTSAVRLDTAAVPAPEPTAPNYVVKATVNPVGNDTSSSEWVAIALSSDRNSTGSIFDPATDAAVYVRSNGQFGLYQNGAGISGATGFSTAAAASYDVTLQVNQSTRAVTVTVNGTTGTATLADMPGYAYVFVQSYFAAASTSEWSTVDNLCVQTVNGFADSFNSATAPVADNDYMLNTDLPSRQQLDSQMSYTRTLGGDTTVQVNQAHHGTQPAYPLDVLSFANGRGAVRLDAPAAADPVTNKFRIGATIDPVVGNTTSSDWVSLVLSQNKNATGYVSDTNVDFAFYLRSTGAMSVQQRGAAVTVVPADPAFPTAPIVSGGVFTVTAFVTAGPGGTATFIVNGKTYTAALTQPVAPVSYLYTGAYMGATSNEVSTLNDLRLNRLTKYYGFYGAVWPDGEIAGQYNNNLGATYPPTLGKAGDYNLNIIKPNLAIPYSAADQANMDAALDGCRVAGCVLGTGSVFYESVSGALRLRSDYLTRWNNMARYVTSSVVSDGTRGIDRLMGFGLQDEPYLPGHDMSEADLAVSADVVKCASTTAVPAVCASGSIDAPSFRNAAVVVEFDSGDMPNLTDRHIPANADIVGFDFYCGGEPSYPIGQQRTELEDRLDTLEAAKTDPAQRLIMFPEARTGKACWDRWNATDEGDAYFAQAQREYNELSLVRPSVGGVMTFGLWLKFSCAMTLPQQPPAGCGPTQYYVETPTTYPDTWAVMNRIGRANSLQGNVP